ncbi:thiazolylpeptide-type bacteriocin [Nonomuraea sp. ATR24]|uniref:thiazolylpeptide-type bacteriocin n=1 Tax=Nonomuraea TaxID=83681 RepID=UPI001C5CF45F|nr:thiazolylpeptide-type bacteriocin [Nonomuraea ceibae]
MSSLSFQVEDLDLNELSVTTMRDGFAVPDTGASAVSCSYLTDSCSSCCSINPR